MQRTSAKEVLPTEMANHLDDLKNKVHAMVVAVGQLNDLSNTWMDQLLEVRRCQQDGTWDPDDLDACCSSIEELQGRLRDILLEMRSVLVVSLKVHERHFVIPDHVQTVLVGALEKLNGQPGEADIAELEHERLLRVPPKKAMVQIGWRIVELCNQVREVGELLANHTRLEYERILRELIAERGCDEGNRNSIQGSAETGAGHEEPETARSDSHDAH